LLFPLLASFCVCYLSAEAPEHKTESVESFVEEKPRKARRGSLSRARREAIDLLEALAHDLAREIEMASSIIRETLQSAHEIIEGKSDSKSMKKLGTDQALYTQKLKEMHNLTQSRLDQIMKAQRWLKQEPA
jgi:hypothetical protein